MRSPGRNGEGELRGQPANPGSSGKMAVKTECVCCGLFYCQLSEVCTVWYVAAAVVIQVAATLIVTKRCIMSTRSTWRQKTCNCPYTAMVKFLDLNLNQYQNQVFC